MTEQENKLVVHPSPHIVSGVTTRGLMGAVIVALLPTAVMAGMIFGPRAWAVIAVTVISCVGFEWLYRFIMRKPVSVGDFSAVVTGLILAFNLPATVPLWLPVIGAFVAIVLVKELFGGLGCNFANPALVGRMVLFVGFSGLMTHYGMPVDAVAGATPLVQMTAGATGAALFKNLFFGFTGGMLGETCAFTLILGGLFLMLTRVISPAIPLTFLGTVAAMSALLGQDVLGQLLSGGLLLAAFFMATDYVTSPFNWPGKIIYGVFLGVVTCLIRFYGTLAEGVSFALLLGNLLVPYINVWTRRMPLGGEKGGSAK